MTFRREGGACISSSMRKKSQNWFDFSTEENSVALDISALNNGRSILAMFLTVLYKEDCIGTETLN